MRRIVLLRLHSAHELYLATTEDGKRPKKDVKQRDPDELEKSRGGDGKDTRSTTSRKARWFKRE
jgi:hypothetical protein